MPKRFQSSRGCEQNFGSGSPSWRPTRRPLPVVKLAMFVPCARYEERREPACAPAPVLRRMVTAGQLARQNGDGFYDGCMAGAYR